MERIRTLIVDDEPQARKGIRVLLARDAEIEVIGECSNGRQAIDYIEEHKPDLVLLDIQMPDESGLDVIRKIDLAVMPTFIFVTAHDSYALKAFELSALDYLLKPFSDERFYQALARAKEFHRRRHAEEFGRQLLTLLQNYNQSVAAESASPLPGKLLQRFVIRNRGEAQFIDIDKVDWIEAVGYYVKLHVGRKTHLIRGHLGGLEPQLPTDRFIRINRSTIVNIARIHSLKSWFHGGCILILNDGTELKVPRGRRREIEHLLEHSS
jgi:two-component system LytT family response regulator